MINRKIPESNIADISCIRIILIILIRIIIPVSQPADRLEDLKKAQQIRAQRAERQANKNPKLTVFSGRMKCGYCGMGVSRRTSATRKRWVCNTRERKGAKFCDCRPIWEEELIKAGAQIFGTSELDEEKFLKEVKQVTVYSDRLEFLTSRGVKHYIRQFNGRRGQNAFTNTVWCSCGEKCQRDKGWLLGICRNCPITADTHYSRNSIF